MCAAPAVTRSVIRNNKFNVALLSLLMAEVFFLWMFMATEPLELMADAGLIAGPADVGIRSAAYDFAARWRHGMSGGWPLYMPGFFLLALTVWFWSMQRPITELCIEAASLTLLAILVALSLQPIGTSLVIAQFEEETGVRCAVPPPDTSFVGIVRGVYTMVTFSAGIISIQRALIRRRLYPLLIPVVMNVVLALVRPWTVADFTGYWVRQAGRFDVVALVSFLAVAITGATMFLSHWAIVSTSRKEDSVLQEQAAHWKPGERTSQ